jgi:hypothetical protein
MTSRDAQAIGLSCPNDYHQFITESGTTMSRCASLHDWQRTQRLRAVTAGTARQCHWQRQLEELAAISLATHGAIAHKTYISTGLLHNVRVTVSV